MIKDILFISHLNLAITCSSDHSLKSWDLDSMYCVSTLIGHYNEVNTCCYVYEKDKKVVIASGGFDNQIILWSAYEGLLLRSLRGH